MTLINRRANLTLMGGIVVLAVALVVAQLVRGENQNSILVNALTVLLLGGLWFAYWRGWEYARYIVVVLTTLTTGLGLTEPFVSREQTFAVLVAPVLALILGGPWWVFASTMTIVICLAARSLIAGVSSGPYTQAPAIILLAMVTGGMVLSRLIADAAQRTAEANGRRAEAALAQSKAQAAELSHKADELAEQIEQQRRLLDLVATLETPVVALAQGVLLAPVVGHLDSRRAEDLTQRLLEQVSAARARMVVLDIAGVPTVDTSVAQALLRAIQAVRLLGCDVTVTGISASIAATMTQLGISMSGVRTARTPQEALEQGLAAGRPVPANGARKN